MPRRHGRKGAFWLADSGATSRNLTSVLNSVDFPRTAEAAQATALQEDDHVYVPGVRGATIRLQGFITEDANQADDVLSNLLGGVGGTAASAFKWFPGGSATGLIVYSGSAYVTGYNPNGAIGGVQAFTADLTVTGSITRGTV
jgi:hypothetical protein